MTRTLHVLLLLFGFVTAQAQIQGYNLNDTVEDFTVIDTKGNEINLYDLTSNGQWVMIDFFFVDCGPCRTTAPIFNEMHEKYGCNDGGVFTMSITGASPDSNAYVLFYEEEFGGDANHAPAVSAHEGMGEAVDSRFNPAAYPTICLISPENKIVNMDIWPVDDYTTFANALADAGSEAEEMECTLTNTEDLELLSIALYPNPAIDAIQVELAQDADRIQIFNTLGQLQVSSKAILGTNQINIAMLDQGMYFLQVKDGDEIIAIETFVKE